MNWKTVKIFGQIKYFSISYAVLLIVPIIANTFHTLNTKFSYILILPDTVKWLYTASLIYAIAIAIYQYKCPAVVKEYQNIQDFIDKNLKLTENKFPDLKLNIVLANLNLETQKETYDEIVFLLEKVNGTLDQTEKSKTTSDLNSLLDKIYSSSIQNHLSTMYNNELKKGKFYIWLSGLLFIAGTVIIVLLLILKTFTVYTN